MRRGAVIDAASRLMRRKIELEKAIKINPNNEITGNIKLTNGIHPRDGARKKHTIPKTKKTTGDIKKDIVIANNTVTPTPYHK